MVKLILNRIFLIEKTIVNSWVFTCRVGEFGAKGVEMKKIKQKNDK